MLLRKLVPISALLLLAGTHSASADPPKEAPKEGAPSSKVPGPKPAVKPTLKASLKIKPEAIRAPELRDQLKSLDAKLKPFVLSDPAWPKFQKDALAATKLKDKQQKEDAFKKLAELGAQIRGRALDKAGTEFKGDLSKVNIPKPPAKLKFHPDLVQLPKPGPTNATLGSFPDLVNWKAPAAAIKHDIDNGQLYMWGVGSPTTSDGSDNNILGASRQGRCPARDDEARRQHARQDLG